MIKLDFATSLYCLQTLCEDVQQAGSASSSVASSQPPVPQSHAEQLMKGYRPGGEAYDNRNKRLSPNPPVKQNSIIASSAANSSSSAGNAGHSVPANYIDNEKCSADYRPPSSSSLTPTASSSATPASSSTARSSSSSAQPSASSSAPSASFSAQSSSSSKPPKYIDRGGTRYFYNSKDGKYYDTNGRSLR
jgi:hypothetical protein